jgi:TetR/AcrR family transcriptional repressor of nem operon
VGAIARAYLSGRHRDDPGSGCLLAALGSDASRQAPPVRRAVTTGLRSALDFLAALTKGRSTAAKRQEAIRAYASWVGAMVLARAVDDAALSREILEAVART